MGGWGNVLRSIGSVGNDVQNARLQNEQDAFTRLQMGLQLQELRQRIAQGNQLRSAGLLGLPGGGTAGVTFDPSKGTYGMQTLIPGIGKEQVFARLAQMLAQAQTPTMQKIMQSYIDELSDPDRDPLDTLQRAEAGFQKMIETIKPQKSPVVNVDKGTVTIYDMEGNGDELPIYDAQGKVNPNLPANVQPLVSSQISAAGIKEKQKTTDEDARMAALLKNQEALYDYKQGKENNEMFDAMLDAIDIDPKQMPPPGSKLMSQLVLRAKQTNRKLPIRKEVDPATKLWISNQQKIWANPSVWQGAPSAIDSQTLAGIADKILGGNHKGDLMKQGGGSSFLPSVLGGGYSSAAYSKKDFKALLDEIGIALGGDKDYSK